MKENIFTENDTQPDNGKQADQDLTKPVIDSDYDFGQAPVLATLIYETPAGGTLPPANLQEKTTIVQEAPMGQTIIYDQDAMGEPLVPESPSSPALDSATAPSSHEDAKQLRNRWDEIQGRFIDEPRMAVDQADTLVKDVIGIISQLFADERLSLENQWKEGDEVSTEDLRKILQSYRSFFNRLAMQIPAE